MGLGPRIKTATPVFGGVFSFLARILRAFPLAKVKRRRRRRRRPSAFLQARASGVGDRLLPVLCARNMFARLHRFSPLHVCLIASVFF